MSLMDQKEIVTQQYADDKNLSIRKSFHAKYSVNKQGYIPWLFEQYRFSKNDSIFGAWLRERRPVGRQN